MGSTLAKGDLVSEQQRDQRGFAVFGDVKDDYGASIHVKQSSDVNGHVWLFTDGGAVQNNHAAALLSPLQAMRLAGLLLQGAEYVLAELDNA